MSRSFPILAAAALALADALTGCGQSACGPENCGGCCDANNVCQSASNDNCGANGSACMTCPGLQTCEQGICAFAGGGGSSNSDGTSSNGTSSSGASTSSTGNTTGETTVTSSSGGSSGTTGTGHHDQVICGDCTQNADCESGFCDFLNQNGNHGFCDSASPCTGDNECGSVQCDPTGGGYCMCPQLGATTSTGGTTGQTDIGTSSTGSNTSSSSTASSSTTTSTGGTTATTESGTVGSTSTGGTTSTTGTTSSSSTTTGGSTTTGTSGSTGSPDQCGVTTPADVSCTSTCAAGYTCTSGYCALDGADGPLEITLRWNTSDDLDLHMVGPNGCELWYGNPNRPDLASTCSTQGELDLDSNAACSVTGAGPVENIIFPAGTVLNPGAYSVRVDLFESCGSTEAIPFEVSVRHGSSTTQTCGSIQPSQADQGSAGSGTVAASFTI